MRALVIAGLATAIVLLPPTLSAQEMSFMPDYVGQHAFKTTQDNILESAKRDRRAGADAPPSSRIDPAAFRALLTARKAELAPEYERRVRTQGRESANAWLRAKAAELGQLDAQTHQRGHR